MTAMLDHVSIGVSDLAAGARDNGAPGHRPEYADTCYGAFGLDPDGHKIEAVCRTAA